MVRQIPTHIEALGLVGWAHASVGQSFQRQSALAHRNRFHTVRDEFFAGIRLGILGAPGLSTNTGSAEEVTRLLTELRYAESTYSTRTGQVAKCIRFCDEDMRSPLRAAETDLLA